MIWSCKSIKLAANNKDKVMTFALSSIRRRFSASDYHCIISQVIIAMWSGTNNSLIYFNTLNQMLKRLAITEADLDQIHTASGIAGYRIMMLFLVSFSLGNEK